MQIQFETGSAGVPPAEFGVAPNSLSHALGQSNEASGETPDAARETRALPIFRFNDSTI
jgi:hypothetical protein